MHTTKSAMLNLVNRYKAVLQKCRLLNIFGTLALVTSLSLGGIAGFTYAYAEDVPDTTGTTGSSDTTTDTTGTTDTTADTTDTGISSYVDTSLEYSPTLSSTVFKDTIADQLEAMGDFIAYTVEAEDGNTTSTTWEDYLKSTKAFESWAAYVTAVSTFYGDHSISPAYTLDVIGDVDKSTDYTAFTIYSVSDTDTAWKYSMQVKAMA